MIQYLVEPPLTAITWSKSFLHDFMSLSYRCEGTLTHSFLQCCFSSLRFVGIRLFALLRFCHSISVRVRSGLWLGHCNTLILLFFSHSVADLLLWLQSLSYCMTQFGWSFICPTAGLTYDLTILLYTEVFMVGLVIARCPSPVAAKQTHITTLHHCAWQLAWHVCANMLCFVMVIFKIP